MPNLLIAIVIFLSYAGLSAYFWRTQSTGKTDPASRGVIGHALLAPLSLHGYLLSSDMFANGGFDFALLNALSLIIWLTLCVYWVARFFYPLGALLTLVLPVAALAAVLPSVFPSEHLLTHTHTLAFTAHISAAMLAYSLFTIAVFHAVLISQVEKRLHQHTLPRVLRNLPPLLSMERLLFQIIAIGFVLLTLTLASGVFFSEQIFGKAAQFNHKVLFGILAWLVFATLLWGHVRYGWRGRIAVRWTVSGFAFLLIAYLGSKFVLEILLRR
ncbi:MAG: cytochrome c biogenesis protein CcsA [Sideroxydans sp.]|nr:cytochrome c biogenesis protein CcsA [Sideroxydans sp.]